MADLNDISLVTQVAVFHNKKAFDQLVRKYQSPVRRFFLNQTLGDEQLSDDLAQDTFIKAYVNITKFKGLSSFSTWLFRIAYNVHYDYIQALSLLKPDERTCITLQLIDGQPVEKIAEITGIPANTVKSHLKRGKDKMTNYLKQNGYDR